MVCVLRGVEARSTGDLTALTEERRAAEEEEDVKEKPLPATEPPKRKNFRTDMGQSAPPGPVGRRSMSSVSGGSRRSTATSTSSSGGIQTLPLATQPSLKGPYEGQKIMPWAKVGNFRMIDANHGVQPDEALAKALEQLAGEDWEKNVDGELNPTVAQFVTICAGLLAVLRLVTHHPETIMVEYKSTTQLLLKQVKLDAICKTTDIASKDQVGVMRACRLTLVLQVKNLRSQVGRAAVHVMAELFVQLKRSMESDLEKIALPLVLKTGETNRFLREDCNLCLDRWAGFAKYFIH